MKSYEKHNEDKQIQTVLDEYNMIYTQTITVDELLLYMISVKEIHNVIEILIKRKIGINYKNIFKTSPLLAAIENTTDKKQIEIYYIKITKLLIDNGVDINTQNRKGTTPLLLSMRINSRKLFNYLLRQDDIDLNILDYRKNDIFDYLLNPQKNNAVFNLFAYKYFSIIKHNYPEKYKKYLRNKNAQKFNL